MSVLLLNADAQPLSLLPLSTISWQSAVKAYFQDKVRIIKSDESRILHSPSIELPYPTVVMLKQWHRMPEKAKFTRRNLFLRDNFQCQYCFDEFKPGDLTIDHVLPRSCGGRTSWTNCTSACRSCNIKKSNNPNIKPTTLPVHPTYYQLNNKSLKFLQLQKIHEDWEPFLFWVHTKDNFVLETA